MGSPTTQTTKIKRLHFALLMITMYCRGCRWLHSDQKHDCKDKHFNNAKEAYGKDLRQAVAIGDGFSYF
jgi:hypothetical protein